MAESVRNEKRKRQFALSGIPVRFNSTGFATYVASTDGQRHALKVAKRFAEMVVETSNRGQSLLLVGKPGCGKTHLAISIALEVLNAQKQAIYTTAPELVRSIRESYNRDARESEASIMNRLADAALLVIDELGIGATSAHGQAVLFEVIDRRYRDCRPMVLLSNLPTEELVGAVGERIVDRLNEIAVTVPFDWRSHRIAAR
jgi:DNA replication protein DnaC